MGGSLPGRRRGGFAWPLRREHSVAHFDEGAVHIVTTATLATLSAATRWPISAERLRANVLLETGAIGFPEDLWLGQVLHLGDVRLRIVSRVLRCVMVNHALPSRRARGDLLKTIGAVNETCAGVYADVVVPGTTRIGDAANLTPPAPKPTDS
jgi:uncharacterized protein YcbX